MPLPDDLLQQHKTFVESLRSSRPSNKPLILSRQSVQGRYLVSCDEIEDGWLLDLDESSWMCMTIMGDPETGGKRLEAEFDFGILEGVMRFRKLHEDRKSEGEPDGDGGRKKEKVMEGDKEKVKAKSTETEEKKQGKGKGKEKDKDKDKNAEGKDNLDDDTPAKNTRNKRKARASFSTSTPNTSPTFTSTSTSISTSSKKLKLESTSSLSAVTTTLAPNDSNSRKIRLSLRWRARETGEGELYADYLYQTGYIEFTNNDPTKFTGIMNIQFIGRDVEFQGYMVENRRLMILGWEDFAMAQWDWFY